MKGAILFPNSGMPSFPVVGVRAILAVLHFMGPCLAGVPFASKEGAHDSFFFLVRNFIFSWAMTAWIPLLHPGRSAQ
jgi:hypothetical protein